MNELLRLARSIRCDAPEPQQAFSHRLRIGFMIAGLIFLISILG